MDMHHSFGLLHRIPPLPTDREPGATPPELAPEAEEYEEQQLFVPADLPGPETPEELEEQAQWEQEEWERVQSYGESYVHDHDPAYQTSSAYPGHAAVQHGYHPPQEHDAEFITTRVTQPAYNHSHDHYGHDHAHHDHDHVHDHDHAHEGHEHFHDHRHSPYDHSHEHYDHEHAHGHHAHDHRQHSSHAHDSSSESDPEPTPIPAAPLVHPQPVTPTPRPAAVRSPSSSVSMTSPVRGSTPTPTRPFGAFMNGDSSRS